MTEHLVKLWSRCEEDPSEVDYQARLPKRISVEHAAVASFPWAGVEQSAAASYSPIGSRMLTAARQRVS